MDKVHPLESSCRRLPALLVDSETSKIRVKSQYRVLGAIIHSCFGDFRNEVEWKQIGRHDINFTLCSTRPTSPHPSAICDGIIEADNALSLSHFEIEINLGCTQSKQPFVGIPLPATAVTGFWARICRIGTHSILTPTGRCENRSNCTQPRDAD